MSKQDEDELEKQILEELATLAYAVSDDYRYVSIESAKGEKHITKYTLPDIMQLITSREQSIKEQAEREAKIWVASRMWYTGMEVGIMDRGAFIPQEHFIRQLHSTNNSLEEKTDR